MHNTEKEYYVYVTLNKNKSEDILRPIMSILDSNNIKEETNTNETYKEVIGRCISNDMEKTAEFIRSFDGITKVTYDEVPHSVLHKEKYAKLDAIMARSDRNSHYRTPDSSPSTGF